MSKTRDALGDRMKRYEGACTGNQTLPYLPVCARIDGKNFSRFTHDLKRPYEEKLHQAMCYTTKRLVEESCAVVGYTQSDEITLLFYSPSPDSQIFFNGKIKKMVSVLASMATLFFQQGLQKFLPEKAGKDTFFDCRVWQVPTLEEAVNVVVWRELDATKNSISMAAQSVYSHKHLQGKHAGEMQEMLFQKGINWNDYPDFFKRGTYFRRKLVETPFTAEEISRLPEKHAARTNPNLKIQRHIVFEEHLPKILSVANKVDVIFRGAEVVLKES